MRIFIGFLIPEEGKKVLEKTQRELKNIYREGVKWSDPNLMHVTLEFLGEISEWELLQVESVLEYVVGRSTHFSCSLGNLTAFPNIYKPRVLVQEIIDLNMVATDFRGSLHEKLVLRGISSDYKQWKPHVTLGRIKANFISLKKMENSGKINFNADSVEIIESKLSTNGAEYKILKSFTLRK